MRQEQIDRDLRHIWHPCSQMKDFESLPPMIVQRAEGAYLHLADGRQLIDATSSWWCKNLGHGHSRLKQALHQQLDQLEHVMLASASHEPVIALSEKLITLAPHLNKVAYAGDGACAIEIAMKMSLHARQILGETEKKEFMALSNAYHGETCGALSVSDVGIYRRPYEALLFPVEFIQDIPYVHSRNDVLWQDCGTIWPKIEKQLNQKAGQLTAILVEPIVQAAAGMQIYSADFLKRLQAWAKENNVHLIADEIFSGLGRTGLSLASDHADFKPDFVGLGKALTGGFMPMSAVLTSDAIYNLFYDDYEMGKSFLHSHTYAGNPLSAAVALETLNVMQDDKITEQVQTNENYLIELMQAIADKTGRLHNVRGIGAVVAADLIVDDPRERKGLAIFHKAVELGALLRPLGNTLYWTLPLNTKPETMQALADVTQRALMI